MQFGIFSFKNRKHVEIKCETRRAYIIYININIYVYTSEKCIDLTLRLNGFAWLSKNTLARSHGHPLPL